MLDLIVDELEKVYVSVLNRDTGKHQLMACAFLNVHKLYSTAISHKYEVGLVKSWPRYHLHAEADVARMHAIDLHSFARATEQTTALGTHDNVEAACFDQSEEEAIFLELDKVIDRLASDENFVLKLHCQSPGRVMVNLSKEESIAICNRHGSRSQRQSCLVALGQAVDRKHMRLQTHIGHIDEVKVAFLLNDED